MLVGSNQESKDNICMILRRKAESIKNVKCLSGGADPARCEILDEAADLVPFRRGSKWIEN